MKKFLFILSTLSTLSCLAQATMADGVRLDEKIDEITYAWDLEADKLSSYEGLMELCADKEYRSEIFGLLKEIHHYDTILYGVLLDLSKRSNNREIAKSLKDIKKFESKYDVKSFVHFMNEECKAAIDIEKHAEETKNEVGYTSYSSQVYLLETELYKYVKHATDKVDKIREHVHHLSKRYEN